MSWHKASLSQEVDWIGWRISVAFWTISLPPDKLQCIVDQLYAASRTTKMSLKDLQSLVGRLLWLTSAWHYLRPLLQPLYRALHRLSVTMIGMDHVVFHSLCTALNDDLSLTCDLPHKHHALVPGIKLVRVANTYPASITMHLKSRCVWGGVLDPTSPHRQMDRSSERSDSLVSTFAVYTLSTVYAFSNHAQCSSYC